MKIVTRLRINVLISIGLVFLIGAMAALAFRLQKESRERGVVAGRMLVQASELRSLTTDFLRHPEERTKQEFLLVGDSLTKLLQESSLTQSPRVADRMLQNLTDAKVLFAELVESSTPGSSPQNRARRELLADEILSRANQLSLDAARVLEINNTELESVTRRITLSTALTVALLALLVLWLSWRLQRAIADPLQALHHGTDVVGTGNLAYRVGTTSPDEIGQVSRSFDRMTEQLQSTVASLRTSEEALRRAAEFDEAALKSLGEGLYTIDTQGLVTSMNPAAEELFGWSFAELRGKKMHDLTHHHYRDGQPFPSSECAGFQVLTSGRPLKNHEDVFIRKDGTFFDVVYSIAPMRDTAGQITGLVVVFADITERKRAEQRIVHLSSFPQLNPNPVFEADMEGKITYANPAALKCFPQLMESDPEYPPLRQWPLLIGEFKSGKMESTSREIEIEGSVFIQVIHHASELGVVRSYFADITERKRAEKERETTVEFLRLVNRSLSSRELIQQATIFFQQKSACEAVGVRLQEGDDYPYFEYRGFSKEFVQLENALCKRDESGHAAHDSAGNPILDCMCGNVIRGRFDASKPFFTAKGSFWTNSTTQLLASTSEADRQARTRNRCNGEGYESVALMALRTGEQRLGLLQLNDKQNGRFSPETMRLWERLADYLAVALSKFRAEEALRASEERWATTLRSIGDAVIATDASGRVMFMNDVAEKLTGWPLSEAQGRDLNEVFNIVNEVTRIRPENPVAKVLRMGQVVGLANHTALISRNGTETPIEDSGAPIRDNEGKTIGVVLVFHDTSEKRRAEKALRDSERLATTGRLASTLAHEIHNPLDTVGSLLYLIERNPDMPEEARQHIAMASEELERVTQMTRHMLSFQREAKNPVPIKIDEILDNVITLYGRKIEANGIRVEKQVEFEGEFGKLVWPTSAV